MNKDSQQEYLLDIKELEMLEAALSKNIID